MSYATLSDMNDRFGRRMLVDLTDRAEVPTGEIDEAVVARALGDTAAVLDGYLTGRYRLPLAIVSPQLRDLALSIAIYKLHTSEPDQKIVRDHDRALVTLAQIANGVIRLSAEGIEPSGAAGTGVVTTDRQRDFSPEQLRGFI